MNPDELPETAFILDGPAMRVRWFRHEHDFPARRFLEQHREDFAQFLHRCREMADIGRIRLRNHGHQLHGEFAVLHQFNLKATRSWGVRVRVRKRTVYLVLDADTKKNDKAQVPDYRRALQKYEDYLNGPSND